MRVEAGRRGRNGVGAPGRWVVDTLLAIAVTSTLALIMFTDQGGERRPDAVAYLFAAGFGALILIRRYFPLGVLAVTVLGLFAYYALGYPAIGVAVPVVAALFTAAEAGHTQAAVAAGSVVLLVSFGFRFRDGEPVDYLLGYELVSNLALTGFAVAFGDAVRTRRTEAEHQDEIARLTTEDAAREAELRLRRERDGISRDLHDTVGHTVSAIAIHAAVAREALGLTQSAASQALDQIRDACRRLLLDLRGIVTVLQAGQADDQSGQTHSLDFAGDLTTALTAAGLAVHFHVDVASSELPAAVDATAYRILQESLTNVARHADATEVVVSAVIKGDQLHLIISDNGRGSSQPTNHTPAADCPAWPNAPGCSAALSPPCPEPMGSP